MTAPGGSAPEAVSDEFVRQRRVAELLALGVMAIWALNFIVVKTAIEVLPPVAFSFVRFTLAAIFLLTVARLREGGIGLPRRDLVTILGLGALAFGLYQVLWTTALRETTAGTSSLLIAATPIFTMLVAAGAGSDTLGRAKLAGAAIAFAGVTLVIAAGTTLVLDGRLVGELMTLGAAALWAVYMSFGAPFLRRHSPLRTTAWGVTGGAIALAPLGVIQFAATEPGWATPEVLLAVAYSGLLSSALANVIVFHGVRLVGPTRIANLQFLVPAIAVVLGVLLLGERIEPVQVVGGAAIVAGILVARRDRSRRPDDERRSPIEAELIEPV